MRNPSEVSSADAWQGTWRSACIGVAGSARGCVLKVASPAVRSFVFVYVTSACSMYACVTAC